MEIKKIFVAGAGLMGGGIAQICAQAGYDVTMRDVSDEILEKSLKAISWSVGKFVEKGKVEGTVDAIMGRLKATTELAAAAEADFVFEAIIENLEAKRALFAELDELCPPHTIFGSNTSAIPVTEIAEATKRVPQVCGTHFFSPVPMMKAVEVIKGLNFPSTIEAIKLVEAGVTTVEDIDKGMRLGFGRPMGPFETADMAGLDIGYNAMLAVYRETRDPKFYPPMLLQRKVKLGQLGRKTGIGWYRYDENGKKIGPAD